MSLNLQKLKDLYTAGDMSGFSRRLLDLLIDLEQVPQDLFRRSTQLRFRYNQALHNKALHTELPNLQMEATLILDALEKLELIPSQPVYSNAEPVCTGNLLEKHFRIGSSQAFHLGPLDITLRLGEITGVVGENGNGKTTLLRIIAGELSSDAGILSYPLLEKEPDEWYLIKQHIVFIPQHLTPWKGSLAENLHFTAAVHGILGRENEEAVDFLLHRLGLSPYKDAYWHEISSGYKLRFELAKALVQKPLLLILDEPLANLDIHAQELLMQDLRYLSETEEFTMAVLVSSQHLHEIERLSDRLIFLRRGEVQYNGAKANFGLDRIENIFELQVDADIHSVREALSFLESGQVKEKAGTFLVQVPLDFQADKILAALIAHRLPVRYFRDISTSTLKLFKTDPTYHL